MEGKPFLDECQPQSRHHATYRPWERSAGPDILARLSSIPLPKLGVLREGVRRVQDREPESQRPVEKTALQDEHPEEGEGGMEQEVEARGPFPRAGHLPRGQGGVAVHPIEKVGRVAVGEMEQFPRKRPHGPRHEDRLVKGTTVEAAPVLAPEPKNVKGGPPPAAAPSP